MPGTSTKFDRCVEGVKESSPDIDKPEAVCVSQGVKPESWKKSVQEKEYLKLHKNGQWSLNKKHEGFEAVKENAAEHGASDPAAVAAAVGRAKYGKEKFQEMAAAGKKMHKDITGAPQIMMSEFLDKDYPLALNLDHAPGSPEAKAHDVMEGDDLHEEISKLSPENRKLMLEHLRFIKEKSKG